MDNSPSISNFCLWCCTSCLREYGSFLILSCIDFFKAPETSCYSSREYNLRWSMQNMFWKCCRYQIRTLWPQVSCNIHSFWNVHLNFRVGLTMLERRVPYAELEARMGLKPMTCVIALHTTLSEGYIVRCEFSFVLCDNWLMRNQIVGLQNLSEWFVLLLKLHRSAIWYCIKYTQVLIIIHFGKRYWTIDPQMDWLALL